MLENGDEVTIDAEKGTIDANLTEDEITLRKKNWTNPKPIPSKGVLSKYAQSVKSASLGAITD